LPRLGKPDYKPRLGVITTHPGVREKPSVPAIEQPPRRPEGGWGWLERMLSRETSGGELLRHVDGLRCIAILCVLVYHINGFTVAKTPYPHDTAADTDPLCRIFAEGHVGVQLFFVISGFILALPFARQHVAGGRQVRLGDYFLRRLIRLEPPYLIALAIMTAAAVCVRGERLLDLLPHLLASAVYGHYFAYGRGSDILPVAWSLEIEAQFYLLAPLLAAVFRLPTAPLRRGAILLVLVTAGALQSLADYPAHSPMHGWTILSSLHWFLAGFVLADCHVAGDLEVSPWPTAWDVLGAAAWFALFLVVQQRFHLHVLGPLLTLVAYAAVFKGSRTRKLLSHPGIYVVGGMCYSIYLYHGLLKAALGRVTIGIHASRFLGIEAAVQIAVLIPPIVAVCSCLFLAFEKPFMSRSLFAAARRKLGLA
jgi:peptidoglycan/LPS O-acetylase OafA/YrhL